MLTNYLTKLCFAISILLTVASCRKDLSSAQEGDTEEQVVNDLTNTKLGKEKANPFSFEVVKKAIEKVKKQKAEKKRQLQATNPNIIDPVDPCDIGGGGGGGGTIYPTHNYVRFAPQNVDQLTELEESGMELFDVPLNYEVIEDGDFYQDPSIPEDQITFQYTLVAYGYPLPSHIPYTILDQIYLFNEDDGEAQEPDPWTGGGGGECDPQTYQTASDPSPNYVLPPCEYVAQYGDPVIAATQTLIDECLQPYEVYQAAVEISGFEEDGGTVTDNNIAARGPRYRPQGNLFVFNTDINNPEPLKGVTVKSRNFMKLGITTTDGNGHFFIDKPYKRKATVLVKFKNNRATTRGINGVLKVWQYVFPVKHKLGKFYNNDLQNITFTFPRETNPHTETARKWVAAITMNAVWDIDQFNQQNNIAAFPRLKIWLSSRITSDASAPMLNYVLAPVIGSLEAQAEYAIVSGILDKLLMFVPYAGQALVVLKRVLEMNKPDVTLRYGDGQGQYALESRELYNTMIHEFSHATHYWGLVQEQPLGGGSQYWWNNAKYTIIHGGYGEKSNNGSERVALVEAWGYFAGNTGNAFKYGNGVFAGNPTANVIRFDEIRQLENAIVRNTVSITTRFDGPGNTSYYRGWIPCGMLHDFTDNGEDPFTGITDNVNAYNINGVFRGLRFTNNTVQEYRQQLLNQNGNLQANEVNNLVGQYGF
jgi:hypothetical protein